MSYRIGTKNVATPGTREALTATHFACTSVIVKPKVDNTNPVYVADDAGNLFPIDQPLTFPVGTPTILFVDAETAGEGVDWIAL